MRIEKLYLNEIGPFENLLLEFQKCGNKDKAEIHIFTGTNGVGKSTILYALASALNSGNKENIGRRFKNKVSSYCDIVFENDEKINISYDSGNSNFLKIMEFDGIYWKSTRNDSYPVSKYVNSYSNYKPYIKTLSFTFVAFAYSGYRTITSYNINSIQEITDNPFNGVLSFTSSHNSTQLIQWLANIITKEALSRNDKYQLKANKFRGSIDKIEKVIKKITDVDIKFILETEPLALKLITEGKILNFDILPDGLKSIISWIGNLSMRMDLINWYDNNIDIFERNFILFLDEIDMHLHPKWQRKILPAVQKLFPNAQIFVSTHSPFVVNSVSDARVYSFDIVDNKSMLISVEDSNAGHSYSYVLADTFNVKEPFAPETEDKFKEFYELRNKMLDMKNIINDNENNKFVQLATELAFKSTEIGDIIGRDLRQLKRITGREIEL